jgi:hypothetical protein
MDPQEVSSFSKSQEKSETVPHTGTDLLGTFEAALAIIHNDKGPVSTANVKVGVDLEQDGSNFAA